MDNKLEGEDIIQREYRWCTDRFLLRCGCGEEFLEFLSFTPDADEEVYTYISYYGSCWNIKKHTSFTLNMQTVEELYKSLKEGKDSYIKDQSSCTKSKSTLVIKVDKEDSTAWLQLFRKFKNVNKPKKCIWEIVLDKIDKDKFIDRLEKHINKIRSVHETN